MTRTLLAICTIPVRIAFTNDGLVMPLDDAIAIPDVAVAHAEERQVDVAIYAVRRPGRFDHTVTMTLTCGTAVHTCPAPAEWVHPFSHTPQLVMGRRHFCYLEAFCEGVAIRSTATQTQFVAYLVRLRRAQAELAEQGDTTAVTHIEAVIDALDADLDSGNCAELRSYSPGPAPPSLPVYALTAAPHAPPSVTGHPTPPGRVTRRLIPQRAHRAHPSRE